jgi:hypothetical protein
MTTGPRSADVRSGFAGCRPHCVRLPPILTARFPTHTDHHVPPEQARKRPPGTQPETGNVSLIVSPNRSRRTVADDVTGHLIGDVTDRTVMAIRDKKCSLRTRSGTNPGSYSGTSMWHTGRFGLVLEPPGKGPGAGEHQAVPIVWGQIGTRSMEC